jgi:hypothetical protein
MLVSSAYSVPGVAEVFYGPAGGARNVLGGSA